MSVLDKMEKLREDESLTLNEDEFDDYIMDMIGVSEEERIKFKDDKNRNN